MARYRVCFLVSLAAGLMLPRMGSAVLAADAPSAAEATKGDAALLDAKAVELAEAIEDFDDESSQEDYNDADADTQDGAASSEDSESDAIASDAIASDEEKSEENAELNAEPEIIQERYPNRSIKVERGVKQDTDGNYINHGAWKMWDERGNLIAEGIYQDGQRHGTWNRWYRSTEAELLSKAPYQQFVGPFISQATFQNGRLHGKWTIYDSKQRKCSQWHFADGNRHGKSVWWYADGHKMREVNYQDGDIDGELLEWSPDAKLTIKDNLQGGRKLATKVDYHGSNQKKSEGIYLNAKDVVQTPDDWWSCKTAVYSKQGKDEKHGPWISWYATGQKQLQGEYRNDVQVGKFSWWFANGQKALEGSYNHGKQSGKWTWWHQNGQKATQGEYDDGNPMGRWTWWREDGKVAEQAELSHSEGKVVETPKVPSRPTEAMLPQPARPKAPLRLRR